MILRNVREQQPAGTFCPFWQEKEDYLLLYEGAMYEDEDYKN